LADGGADDRRALRRRVREKPGRAADALGGGVAEPIGTLLGSYSSIVER
jgi:hypothetical protein